MGQAVAVVADVVWTALVSTATAKVVTKVAEEIGVSDDVASLMGIVAGGFAGNWAKSQASTFLGDTVSDKISNPLWGPSAGGTSVPEVGGAATQVPDINYGLTGPDNVQATSSVLGATPASAPAPTTPWWKSDVMQTTIAGGVSGFAQGAAAGMAMDDKMKEDRRIRREEEQKEDERIQKWVDNASFVKPEATPPSVAAPRATLDKPGVEKPIGMLRR